MDVVDCSSLQWLFSSSPSSSGCYESFNSVRIEGEARVVVRLITVSSVNRLEKPLPEGRTRGSGRTRPMDNAPVYNNDLDQSLSLLLSFDPRQSLTLRDPKVRNRVLNAWHSAVCT